MTCTSCPHPAHEKHCTAEVVVHSPEGSDVALCPCGVATPMTPSEGIERLLAMRAEDRKLLELIAVRVELALGTLLEDHEHTRKVPVIQARLEAVERRLPHIEGRVSAVETQLLADGEDDGSGNGNGSGYIG